MYPCINTFGLVTPCAYVVPAQQCFIWWLVACRHQAITGTNVYLSSKHSVLSIREQFQKIIFFWIRTISPGSQWVNPTSVTLLSIGNLAAQFWIAEHRQIDIFPFLKHGRPLFIQEIDKSWDGISIRRRSLRVWSPLMSNVRIKLILT